MAADNDHTPTFVSLVIGLGDSGPWVKRRVPGYSIACLRRVVQDQNHAAFQCIMEDLNYLSNSLACS